MGTIFTFDERPSDSPFVERIWRAESERVGDFLSVAASHWEMVVSKYRDETTVTVRGPETIATTMHVTLVGGEFWMHDRRAVVGRMEGVGRSHSDRTFPAKRNSVRAIPCHGRQP